MTLYRNEIEAYFKTLETDTVKYEVTIMDAANDMATQASQVDNFIAQGVDVMIINLVQSSSAATITEKAEAANIPVVYINREPSAEDMEASENITYVGVDALDECVEMVEAGTMTGTVLNDHIGQSHGAVDAAIDFINGNAVEKYIWVDYQKVN